MSHYGIDLRTMAIMSGGRTSSRGDGKSKATARILVVDDQDFIRDLYTDMFESRGHTVFSARNGEEAVESFRTMKAKPDAIIMDHRMPGKDGIQTTKEILEIDPSMPIIFSSADEEVREEAIRAGAVSFWAKPFPVGMLIDATMDLVRARKN